GFAHERHVLGPDLLRPLLGVVVTAVRDAQLVRPAKLVVRGVGRPSHWCPNCERSQNVLPCVTSNLTGNDSGNDPLTSSSGRSETVSAHSPVIPPRPPRRRRETFHGRYRRAGAGRGAGQRLQR